MLQGIFNSRRLKWNLIWFVIWGLYVAFPTEARKILSYIVDQSTHIYDSVVLTIGINTVLWIKLIAIGCIGIVGLYFVWKRLREVFFRYRVESGKIQPIIADGIIQEVKVDEYDDGYRNKGRNYTPNYTRSCKVQWVVPGFGEGKEDVFSFNLLKTKIPSEAMNIEGIQGDPSDISPDGYAMKFIQQHIKLGSKMPVIIHPDNISLYYVNDPLLKLPVHQNTSKHTIDTKIALGTMKRFVIVPTAIILGGGVLVILIAIVSMYL